MKQWGGQCPPTFCTVQRIGSSVPQETRRTRERSDLSATADCRVAERLFWPDDVPIISRRNLNSNAQNKRGPIVEWLGMPGIRGSFAVGPTLGFSVLQKPSARGSTCVRLAPRCQICCGPTAAWLAAWHPLDAVKAGGYGIRLGLASWASMGVSWNGWWVLGR